MAVTQTLVATGTLLYLYRFLLETIGVEKLGIWSLVLASTSLTQFANMGISGGVVKFVAKYFTRQDQENLNGVVQTALLSLSALSGLALIVAYPLCALGLAYVMPAASFPAALQVLPHALFTVWIMMVGSVFQSCLDGVQRIDLRSITQIISTLVYFVLCLVLVRGYGLPGLAWARIIQSAALVLLSCFFLWRYLPAISFFPLRWDKRLFKEMIGYGTSFQVMSLMGMLYDPTTKAILSKLGGLSLVGYYEMASRMIAQLQSVINSATGVMVPVVAEFQEKTPDRIRKLYLVSYQVLVYLALPLHALVIVSAPLISKIWIGHYEPVFTVYATLLAAGWFLNSLNNPAYFTYLGTGELRWNTLAHVLVALCNAALGILLGLWYGGAGVVTGRVFSLALGFAIIAGSFHLKNRIPLTDLLPGSSRLLSGVCLLGVLAALVVQYRTDFTTYPLPYLSMLIGFSLTVLVSMWFHPVRHTLLAHFGKH